MENNIFPTTDQEAQRAANELHEIKVQVRELLGKLTQIEKRLKAISPTIQTKIKSKQKSGTNQLFSEQQLKEKYEMFANQFKDDTASVISQLQSMDKEELLALTKFLGCPVSKSPSMKKLVELIVGRLKESKLLRG